MRTEHQKFQTLIEEVLQEEETQILVVEQEPLLHQEQIMLLHKVVTEVVD